MAENARINKKIRDERKKEAVEVRKPAPITAAEKDVRNLKIIEDACKNEEREIWLKECKSIDAKIGHNNVLREMKIAELKQLDKKNTDLKNEKRKFEEMINEKFPIIPNKKRKLEPLSPPLSTFRESGSTKTGEVRRGVRTSRTEPANDEVGGCGALLPSVDPISRHPPESVSGTVDGPSMGRDRSQQRGAQVDRAEQKGRPRGGKDEFEIAKQRGYKGRREDFIPGFNRMSEKEKEEAKKKRDERRVISEKKEKTGSSDTSAKNNPPDCGNASARAAEKKREETADDSEVRSSESAKHEIEKKKDMRKVVSSGKVEPKGEKERKKFVKEKIYSSSSSDSLSSDSISSSSSSSETEGEEEAKKAKERKLKLKEELKEALEKKSKPKKSSSHQDNQRLAREEQARLHPQEHNGSAQRLEKKGTELRKRLQFEALVEEDEEEALGAVGGE